MNKQDECFQRGIPAVPHQPCGLLVKLLRKTATCVYTMCVLLAPTHSVKDVSAFPE